MGIYTSHNGTKSDTVDMPIEYIVRALAKARSNGDTANIKVLEDEINLRNGRQNSN